MTAGVSYKVGDNSSAEFKGSRVVLCCVVVKGLAKLIYARVQEAINHPVNAKQFRLSVWFGNQVHYLSSQIGKTCTTA